VFSRQQQACLSVADNGRGIAPEVRDRIFDPFFSTKPEGAGAGLGLTIAERIAQTHGGELDIASEPGVGTTVTLFLPRLSPESGEHP
jgi:signal transduction histidine kinase